MSIIIPAILPTSRKDLEDKLSQLEGIASRVQIDIVDGIYAKPASWPYVHDRQSHALEERVQPQYFTYLGNMHIEMDLMVSSPEADIKRFIDAGANRIVIHATSSPRLPQILESFQTQYGHEKDFAPGLLAFGIAIHIDTDTSLIEPYLSRCDYVQFMGIKNVGHQGERFDPSVLTKISRFKSKYPDMQLQVDGGVSLETAPQLLSAGVSRLVVGSALWNAQSISQRFREFTELTEQFGNYS